MQFDGTPASGAAFSQQVFMSESEIKVDGETTSSFRDSNEMRVEEVFCSNCFTRLFNRNTGLPGAVLLYAGTLKESDRLIPIAHIWTSRKQPWVIIDDRITAFAKTPTPEEFGRIMETARSAIFRG